MRQKVALVTGGGSGLGAAIARALVREGATVVVTDIRPDAGQRVANELHCRYLQQDVADEQQWRAIVENVERECGGLHVLVNNAGIEGPFDAADPETTRLADWQRIQRVNVEGVFLGCRTAIPAMRRSGGGSIVNVSSVAALGATPGFVAYGASKAAMHHLTKSGALVLRDHWLEDPLQFRASRRGDDTHAAADLRGHGQAARHQRRAGPRGVQGTHSARRIRRARRCSQCRPVPGVRHVQTHHRHDPHRRWGLDAGALIGYRITGCRRAA
jgi:short-subunit dehydrogenase involved in D-alanine esterification of teichoic acids